MATERVILKLLTCEHLWERVSEASLGNPQRMLDVMMFVRIATGEVGVRAQEEEMELKIFPF
eukprot:586718-Prorocentrum_lima.AAC.1